MVYIHIPFCESYCTYCGFYSELCTPDLEARQVQSRLCALIAEEAVERHDEIESTLALNTLYIGGGTPSLLPLEDLKTIINALNIAPRGEEFTIEVNPEDIVSRGEGYVRGLLELGVTRISMGVQSFDDGILQWMNRRHDSIEAQQAFRILRDSDVDNLSIDLIFGLSQLTPEIWADTIKKTLALRPEHISAYQLSIEEGSLLERMVESGSYTEASDEQCAEQYELLCSLLCAAGYIHYEISNWALPGREARHNSAYWARLPYVGLGPGAHSFDGTSRSWNSESVQGYERTTEVLSDEDVAVETIMLSLRTSKGIEASYLYQHSDREVIQRLLRAGALTWVSGERIRIPEDHFFVSEDIICELI